MAQRRNLLSIDYHYDDDTGMYEIDELDYGISSVLGDYIQRNGYKDILSMLGHLAWAVKEEYFNPTNKK